MNFSLERLPNGVRLAVAEIPHVESVSIGVWLGVGGRHENPDINGIAHFVEHMLFKGTPRRNAKQISQAVEGLGGYLNAFTSEESTCYFARIGAKHLNLVTDVLLDMVLNSEFDPEEIERERGVILEEIRMYEDQPSQVAHEQATALIFKNNPLGLPLAGSPENVARFKQADLRDWTNRFYHSGNLAITVAGKVTLPEVRKLLAPLLEKIPVAGTAEFIRVGRAQTAPRCKVLRKPIEQTHLVLANRAISKHDPRRFALRLASIILGENMSSRLFQSVREQRGLAYSISSSLNHFADTGIFTVQAGLENQRFIPALKLILKTVGQLAQKAPSAKELRSAKEYACGQMYLALESTENQMIWLGEGLLGHDKIPTPAEIDAKIEAVTAEEVRAVSEMLARPESLNIAVVSPTVALAQVQEVFKAS